MTSLAKRLTRPLGRQRPAREKRVTWRQDIRKHYQLYLLMTPYFLLFFLMIVVPVLVAIVLSFTYYNMLEAPRFIGLTNYNNLLVYDSVFYIALKNTLIFAAVTGPLSYVLCYFLAWLINGYSRFVRVLLTLIFYVPSLSSSIYFIWQFIFSGDTYGMMNSVLMSMGLLDEPLQWLSDARTNLIILMVVQVWMSFGTGFLSFIAGFQSVDREFYEAGRIDGIRNRYQELFYITMPMMKPQMLFGAIMQISASFSVSTISMQLCGFPSTKYSAHTIVLHILDYGNYRYEMGYACAVSVVLFILMLLFKRGIDLVMRYISDD